MLLYIVFSNFFYIHLTSHSGREDTMHYVYFDVLILFSSRIMNSEAELIFVNLSL